MDQSYDVNDEEIEHQMLAEESQADDRRKWEEARDANVPDEDDLIKEAESMVDNSQSQYDYDPTQLMRQEAEETKLPVRAPGTRTPQVNRDQL